VRLPDCLWNGLNRALCCGLTCAVALVGLTQVGCTKPAPARKVASELVPAGTRILASDFTVTDMQSHRITLSQYKGKVVLLDFWATTCGGCKVEIPWYVEFDKKYRDEGLALVGIDVAEENVANVKPFIAHWQMDYPVAVGSDALAELYRVQELPLTLLIDRTGRIAVSHAGIIDKAQFESEIRELLR
jgi:thiol-disulfide isomerase/thioredoxin